MHSYVSRINIGRGKAYWKREGRKGWERGLGERAAFVEYSTLLSGSSASANSTPQESAFSQVPRPISFPDNFHAVLLKGIGSIPEAIAQQSNVVISTYISSLYQYVVTAANPPLSAESCALLTICYLSSLQPGEAISAEQLHAMLHYTQIGETEWLQYYRKHRKMSESTFVQSQLVHLSKIAVYPVVGRVQVIVSSQSLAEGVLYTLASVAHVVKTMKANLPDFVVVLTAQSSLSMEFCVLVLHPIQARLVADCSCKVGHGKANHTPPPCPDLQIDKDLLLCMRGQQRRLGGKVLPPFMRPGEGNSPLSPEGASGLAPTASHVIEHRPEGPYQQQYAIALFLLQKTLAAVSPQTRMEDFDNIDFVVLCPSEDSFTVQIISDILESQLLVRLDGDGEGAGLEPHQLLMAAEKRVIECGRSHGSEKFEAFLSNMEAHPKTLYVVVAENAHLLTGVAMESAHFSEAGCHIENGRLLSASNALLLCVTSHPYSLQTNRSLLPANNEVYWPAKDGGSVGELQFWSSSVGKPAGLVFREDAAFEKLFHDVCCTQW